MTQFPKRVVTTKGLRTVGGIAHFPQHIARLKAGGHFPKWLVLGLNRVARLLSEIEEWPDARVAKHDARVTPNTS